MTKGLWMPVAQTLDLFRNADDCQPPASHKEGLVQTSASNCKQGRGVVLITMDGAGHQWPGGKSKTRFVVQMLGLDPPSTALDATAALWEFFKSHPAQP